MYDFHSSVEKCFEIQLLNAREFVIPFIEKHKSITPGLRVLEIGCAEGGVLKAFLEKGCEGYGIELVTGRLESAKLFLSEYVDTGKVHLWNVNIYDYQPAENQPGFDIIILKDVIEHIPEQARLLREIRKLVAKDGLIFIGFPPWNMPFGGHQQCCNSVLSKVPYLHLLPKPIYLGLLKYFGEHVQSFEEIRETRLSINRFLQIVRENKYKVQGEDHYFINPIYKYKFGTPPVRQSALLFKIPFVRDFFTTCVNYLITPA